MLFLRRCKCIDNGRHGSETELYRVNDSGARGRDFIGVQRITSSRLLGEYVTACSSSELNEPHKSTALRAILQMRRVRRISRVIDMKAKTVERKFSWEKMVRGEEERRQVRVQRPQVSTCGLGEDRLVPSQFPRNNITVYLDPSSISWNATTGLVNDAVVIFLWRRFLQHALSAQSSTTYE